MTIREIAEANGTSVQNIYKKLKSRKISVATLKDSTGQLTEAGEQTILELLKAAPADVPPPSSEELNQLKIEVEKLKTENTRLTTQVENLEKQVADLTGERDFLRRTLDTTTEALTNAQKLQAATLAKVPLLTSGEPGRLRRAWDKIRGKDRHE